MNKRVYLTEGMIKERMNIVPLQDPRGSCWGGGGRGGGENRGGDVRRQMGIGKCRKVEQKVYVGFGISGGGGGL